MIFAALRSALGKLRGVRALEVGCGTGQVLAYLERQGLEIAGLDMHLEGLRFARKRSRAPLICSDARGMPFRDEFDLVLVCDVIEHLEDDLGLLRECCAAVKPGGHILITVPAGMWLWSEVDEQVGHKRRYSSKGLKNLLSRAGLEVELLHYFNGLIAPILFLRHWVGRKKRPPSEKEITNWLAEELKIPPWPLNGIMYATGCMEAALSSCISPPFGISLIAVARRPSC